MVDVLGKSLQQQQQPAVEPVSFVRQAIAVLIKEYKPSEAIFTQGLQFLSSKDHAEIYMALIPGTMRDEWL